MQRALIYLIPGIFASKLDRIVDNADPSKDVNLWIDPPKLFTGGLQALQLGSGVAIRPSGTIGFPVELQTEVQKIASDEGCGTREYPWDWRASIISEGQRLAADMIDSAPTYPDGFYLVCHSMGGLVARAAWTALGNQADTLINRIVTLATPHMGSYAYPAALALKDQYWVDTVKSRLASLPNPSPLGGATNMMISGLVSATAKTVLDTLGTWTGGMMTAPHSTLLTPTEDPDGPKVFQSQHWSGSPSPPSQAFLDKRGEWEAFSLQSQATIPVAKLIMAAGGGIPTPYRAIPASNAPTGTFLSPASPWLLPILKIQNATFDFQYLPLGDGRVLTKSAAFGNVNTYTFNATTHDGIMSNPDMLRQLHDWLFTAPPGGGNTPYQAFLPPVWPAAPQYSFIPAVPIPVQTQPGLVPSIARQQLPRKGC